MQQGKYADAASAVKTVIDSPHALATNDDLALGSAYNKIRTTDGLAESIYSYEYNATISNGGWWPTYAFNSAATAIFGTYSIFERTYGPTNQFLNVYAANDLRIQPINSSIGIIQIRIMARLGRLLRMLVVAGSGMMRTLC